MVFELKIVFCLRSLIVGFDDSGNVIIAPQMILLFLIFYCFLLEEYVDFGQVLSLAFGMITDNQLTFSTFFYTDLKCMENSEK